MTRQRRTAAQRLKMFSIVLAIAMVVSMVAVPIAATGSGGSTAPAETDTAGATHATEPVDVAAYDTTCEFPVTLTDATGEDVTLEEPPERITTTNPSAAQVLWEIGGQEQVVGLSQFAQYLDGADDRTNVSAADFGVSIERVVDTEPDLVLAPNATPLETVEALRDVGVTVYHFPEATTIDDVRDKTDRIGKLTDNCEGADRANAWMDANVETAEEATADVERPKILYPLGGGFAAGNGTFINEMLVASGAENIAADEFDGYQVISDEVVIERDPEVLLLTHEWEHLIDEEPFAGTTAGENGAYVLVETDYLNQPAPRSVVYTVRNVTAEIHSDRYGEVDFVTREEAHERLDDPEAVDDDAAADDDSPTDDEVEDDQPTDEADDEPTTDEAEPTVTADEDDGIPGFGLVGAIVAMLSIAGLLSTRRS